MSRPWACAPCGLAMPRKPPGHLAPQLVLLTIFNFWVIAGREVQAIAGMETIEQPRLVLQPFEPSFQRPSQLGDVAFDQVRQGLLEHRPDTLGRVQFGGASAAIWGPGSCARCVRSCC